ncbi:YciI family protein [Aeromicrobium wangtongii]|uniref:YciI family protein n=1 Tax=Aeromicrobium wangtongii TaxID=2969247 RepID=UPI0020180A3A|nr:YciI family protein [Aeromicrobium wangtongii]MCL3819533.1 YciI family protein [Aeromicrobium wangtongii]
MTQYMLSVHHTGPYPDPTTDEAQASFAATGDFTDKIRETGQWVFVGGLLPLDTSTRVDGRSDEVIVTDGAFAESKEYLAGFWVVEVADLDEALKLGAEASKACGQPVDVRPFAGE